ncbi:MAG: cyclic nucleotide-binding domain-containing protein [Desulfobacterales bacterium]|nr:cyclic nucleotide-binding domain-containing protein [Desulfobacterales bacterium]
MTSNILCFKPFIFMSSPDKDIHDVSRLFQIQRGEILSIRSAELNEEYLYIVTGKINITTDDGNVSILDHQEPAVRPFRMPKDSRLIRVVAETDSIFYHVDIDKLETLLFWVELKSITDEKQENLDIRIDKISSSPAFRELSPDSVCEAVSRTRFFDVNSGDEIIRQGDPGDAFYIIVSGVAEVWAAEFDGEDQKKVCDLHEGEAFGEEALISDKPRNATVRMNTDGKLMVLDKKDFIELLSNPLLAEVDSDEAKRRMEKGFKMLDVRYEEENEELYIPGSILIPLNELRQRSGELDKNSHYVVYCRSGKRSAVAALLLNQRNYEAVSMKGGIQTWQYELEGYAA